MPSLIGCGNKNPNVYCKLMRCDYCNKLRREKQSKNIIELGHRPIGRLDTSRPPKGGSAVFFHIKND